MSLVICYLTIVARPMFQTGILTCRMTVSGLVTITLDCLPIVIGLGYDLVPADLLSLLNEQYRFKLEFGPIQRVDFLGGSVSLLHGNDLNEHRKTIE